MTTNGTINGKEGSIDSSAENQKLIEIHKIAAKHHEAAAKYHNAAAKLHEAGNHEKAVELTLNANRHSWFAQKYEMENTEQQALVRYHDDLISHVLI
ncbi:MAG: hypothetical protein ACLQQ4_08195 [Bacteroidia bacterium]